MSRLCISVYSLMFISSLDFDLHICIFRTWDTPCLGKFKADFPCWKWESVCSIFVHCAMSCNALRLRAAPGSQTHILDLTLTTPVTRYLPISDLWRKHWKLGTLGSSQPWRSHCEMFACQPRVPEYWKSWDLWVRHSRIVDEFYMLRTRVRSIRLHAVIKL